MKSIAEQIKEKAIADQQAVEDLRVYAVRMKSDEGWHFITARNSREAQRKATDRGLDGQAIRAATHVELIGIAARALQGL